MGTMLRRLDAWNCWPSVQMLMSFFDLKEWSVSRFLNAKRLHAVCCLCCFSSLEIEGDFFELIAMFCRQLACRGFVAVRVQQLSSVVQ